MRKLLVCFSLVFSFVYAQKPLLDQNRKHEIGTAVQGLFGSGGGYGLTYRRMFSNGAFRFGLNLDGNRVDSDRELTSSTMNNINEGSEENRFSIVSRLGYEGHIWLSPRWMAYVGGDILLGASSSTSTRTSLVSGTEVKTENRNSSYSIGLAPLLGLRFQVSPRVSFGTELRYIADLAFTEIEATNVNQSTITSVTNSLDFSHYFSRPAGIYLQLAL